MAELVAKCLEKDPTNRPSAEQCLASLRELAQPALLSKAAADSPFRGLLPFRERHAAWFFGRDREIAAFVERLRNQPVIPVVGASAAGKSSFVGAGVVARLREQESWQIVKLRPGARPMHALVFSLQRQQSEIVSEQLTEHGEDQEDGDGHGDGDRISELPLSSLELETNTDRLRKQLAESPQRLAMELRALAAARSSKVLLFVDQLEELFTLCDDERARAAFIQAVCGAADDAQDPVRVVFTIRDDFLGRLAAVPASRAALSQVTVLHAPDADALAQIIEQPLERLGYRCDDDQLASDMVKAVSGEPACLPLLEFMASELWARRDEEAKLLLRSAYDKLGGVEGALSTHADGVLDGLWSEQLAVARSLLLRLVTAARTRKVVSRRDALDGLSAEAEVVLERLTEARLISVSRAVGTVGAAGDKRATTDAMLELAHESLVATWPTLAKWIDESREDLAFIAEAQQAAQLWDRRGRRQEELWRGGALHDALRSRARCDEIPELVSGFLAASEEREASALRRRRWLKLVAATVLVGLTAIAVAVSLVIAKKERTVRTERDRAEKQHHEARRGRAAALREGALAAQQHRSLLEARTKLRSALEIEDSAAARALWWQLRNESLVWKKRLGAPVRALAFSPNGRWVAAGRRGRVVLLDRHTGASRALRGQSSQTLSLAFSNDGALLASGDLDGMVGLWDVATGALKRLLRGHEEAVECVSFSPDQRWLASGSADKTVRVWDAVTGAEKVSLSGHDGGVNSVDFSPDGRLLVTGGADKMVRLWDVPAGSEKRRLPGHEARVYDVRFSPDGRLLASASLDKTVRFWDVASGSEKRRMSGHVAVHLSFSPDGRLLASAGYDKTVRIWDVATGSSKLNLSGHEDIVARVAFSPDGRVLATCSFDKTVRLWDLAARGEQRRPSGHESGVTGLSFSPDGRVLASCSSDKTVRLWDVANGIEKLSLLGHEASVEGVSYSPDGRLLASGSSDKTIGVWDGGDGSLKRRLRGHEGTIYSLSFSPDGRLLASGSTDNTVRWWDVEALTELRPPSNHNHAVIGVSFSSDGRLLASGGFDKTIRLWRVADGREQRALSGHAAAIYGVSFGPTSRLLVSGSVDKTVRLWEAATGTLLHQLDLPARVHWPDLANGQRVGVPSADGLARIWDPTTGRLVVLRGHSAEVNYLRFSPDGKLAATSSDDGSVRLWHADSGIPYWRGPLLLFKPPRFLSHRGWTRLRDGAPVKLAPARWRSAVEERGRRADLSPDGATLCLHTFDGQLEVWDTKAGIMKRKLAADKLRDVRALPGGCLLSNGDSASIVPTSGSPIKLASKTKVGAVARIGDSKVLVHSDANVVLFDTSGKLLARYPTGVGVSAVALIGGQLIVGDKAGALDLHPAGAAPGQTISFQNVPASAATRIIAGPPGTVVIGFANGNVGLWSLADRKRLAERKLHGSVQHLLLEDKWLYAATDLGQQLSWDFSTFYEDYCVLMRQVWKRVPTIWQAGRPLMGAPPADHRCAPQ